MPDDPLPALAKRLEIVRHRVHLARLAGRPAPSSAQIARRVREYLAFRGLTVEAAAAAHNAWRAGLPAHPLVVRAYLRACTVALRSP